MPETRVGISGWRYEPWRETFYPKDLPQRLELNYAASKLNSIEINGTFYSLQKPEFFREWSAATPDDFVFAIKGGRYITHLRRLNDVRGPLANFFASGLFVLGKKLGPMLWQFPPNFSFKAERFREFFEMLPRDTRSAASLAAEAEKWMKGRAYVDIDANRPMRHAMEVRHKSFSDPEFVKLCREYGIAIVVADTAGKWPLIEKTTADFVYSRLHGDKELYVSGYTDKALDAWAAKFESWRRGGRDVFVYFDNDVKVHAPYDAMGLARRLGLKVDEEAARRPANLEEVGMKLSARTKWPAFDRNRKNVKKVVKKTSKKMPKKTPKR